MSEKTEAAKLILDFLHRAAIHHALWIFETEEQLGRKKSGEILRDVCGRSGEIQLRRISKALGIEMEDGLPKPLLDLPRETLDTLKKSVAVIWLANDGVWFQAVESTEGMKEAKSCNDACWARFSPFEAWSIRRLLGLSERPGLEGLERALDLRLYAAINEQSVSEKGEKSFVFQMNDCRVQSARQRKGLPDYPCKSAGIIEYTTFAKAIDSRIHTECIGCPPDPHPDEWYCSWRFTLDEE
jgi:hypothetical protein